MTKPILTYFETSRSRGEECRLALVLSGVDFEDRRVTGDQWAQLKSKTPFGTLPTLELPGRPPVSQSNAILTHIGRNHGLLPNDAWEAFRHEALLCAAEDLRHAISATFGIKDPSDLEQRRIALVNGPIPTWAQSMETQIEGPYVGGSAISVADIKVFIMVGWLNGGILDHIPKDVLAPYPKLQKLYESVKQHPKIVAWYARPAAQST